jgi:hypothetical protein
MLLGTASDLRISLPLLCRDVGNENTWVDFHREPPRSTVSNAPRMPTHRWRSQPACPNHPPLSLALPPRARASDQGPTLTVGDGRGSLPSEVAPWTPTAPASRGGCCVKGVRSEPGAVAR